jgi:hypothetical protein
MSLRVRGLSWRVRKPGSLPRGETGRPRPETEIIDDNACAFAAARTAYKADMPVVTIAEGGFLFVAAKPEFTLGEWILSRYSLGRFPLGAG